MVLVLDLLTHTANITLTSIVSLTIVECEFAVFEKFLNLLILVVFYLLLYRAEVHRISNYFRIISQPEGNWIYGGSKEPSKFLATEILQ